MERKQILKLVLVALFTALITAGAYIKIPVGPVPVSLCTFFVNLTASCLPLPLALATVLAYLFLGIIGLPVFTSGGGLAALMGPTGGYLVGFLFLALIQGSLMFRFPGKNAAAVIGMILGTAVCYCFGTAWLAGQMHLSFGAALTAGVIPYLPGDAAKIILAALAGPKLSTAVRII